MLRAGQNGEDAMKKFIVALFVTLLAAMPLAAEAQTKKKKKKNEEQNPLVLLLGIFSTANCAISCGASAVTVTTTFIPREERLVTVVTKKSAAGAFVAGAALCTGLWPFINLALGGKEPTSEEALLNTISCWVPGLGLILYLQEQGAFQPTS
jgi:hypothetical protein